MCTDLVRCPSSLNRSLVKLAKMTRKFFGSTTSEENQLKFEALPEAFKTGSLKERAAEAQTSTDPLVFEAAMKDSKGVFKALLSNEAAMKDPALKAKVEAKVEEGRLRNAQLAADRVAKAKAERNADIQARRRATLADNKARKEIRDAEREASAAAEAARIAALPVLTPAEQAARNAKIRADYAASQAARSANLAAKKAARQAELAAKNAAPAEAPAAPAKAVKPKKVAKPRSLAAVSASIAKKAAAGEEIRTKAKAVPAKAKHPTQAVVEQAQAEFEGRDKTFIATPMRTEGANLTGEEYKPLKGTFKNKAPGEHDRTPKHKVHAGTRDVGESLPDSKFPFGAPTPKKKRPVAKKVTVVPANQPFPGLALAAEERRAAQAEQPDRMAA